jgi:hypothetical protein
MLFLGVRGLWELESPQTHVLLLSLPSGPLNPLLMALALVLMNIMLNQTTAQLPGHVAAAIAGCAVSGYAWPGAGVNGVVSGLSTSFEQLLTLR